MFLKIVKNTTIVDAMQTLKYVRQNTKNKTIITCEPELANGIVSSDGSTIWHLEGLPKFATGNYETVTAIEVCEDEYNSIQKSLYSGEEVSETVRENLTTTEMMETIEKLTTRIAELEKQLASK